MSTGCWLLGVLQYAPGAITAPTVAGIYALPVSPSLLNLDLIRRPHQDYPAWDLALPVGTPVYAVHTGTVTSTPTAGRCGLGVVVAGLDSATYTYCQASQILVATGDHVAAGQLLLLSGNTGRTTGPHLHLAIPLAPASASAPSRSCKPGTRDGAQAPRTCPRPTAPRHRSRASTYSSLRQLDLEGPQARRRAMTSTPTYSNGDWADGERRLGLGTKDRQLHATLPISVRAPTSGL